MADTGKMRFLKRFPESKHEQILQVMNYLQMCGLSGRDIVSIGGWIDRAGANDRYQAARERIQVYIDQKTIRPIGKDDPEQMANRFKYRGITGDYNFSNSHWGYMWNVTSMRTRTTIVHHPQARDWPSRVHWNQQSFYNMMLDIADGKINLNF